MKVKSIKRYTVFCIIIGIIIGLMAPKMISALSAAAKAALDAETITYEEHIESLK